MRADRNATEMQAWIVSVGKQWSGLLRFDDAGKDGSGWDRGDEYGLEMQARMGKTGTDGTGKDWKCRFGSDWIGREWKERIGLAGVVNDLQVL